MFADSSALSEYVPSPLLSITTALGCELLLTSPRKPFTSRMDLWTLKPEATESDEPPMSMRSRRRKRMESGHESIPSTMKPVVDSADIEAKIPSRRELPMAIPWDARISVETIGTTNTMVRYITFSESKNVLLLPLADISERWT